MENSPNNDDRNMAELASDYVETYMKIAVVNINQKTADISAVASFSMISGSILFLFCMFSGIAASIWIGGVLNSYAIGFLLVGVFFVLLLLVLFLSRKKIFYPFIRNLVIKSIYE